MVFADTYALNRYETWELDEMVAQIERPNPWLLGKFFTREKLFGTRSIEFDFYDRARRLAPFVSPLVSGRPMLREGFHTKQLSPAYIKPTDIVLPTESFTRLPGEPYGGVMTPMQRMDRLVAEKLNLHMEAIDNRMEWMAAQVLVNGYVDIEGEDYPLQRIDFKRAAALNIYLLGASKWSKPTANPMQDIENAALLTRRLSKGAVVDTLLMDGLAWNVLRQHASIQDMLDVRFRRHLGEESRIDMLPRTDINIGQYVGTLGGKLDIWVYDAYYQDDSGQDLPYLPPYTVLGLSPQLGGTQYYGAIIDLDAALEPRKLFSKSKIKFNPSGVELISQSAPICAPRRPNAMFRITVQ